MLESKAKTCRSSRLQMFFKIGVLKNFANFTGNQLYWSFFLIKLQAWVCNFIKKKLNHRCFHARIQRFKEISQTD